MNRMLAAGLTCVRRHGHIPTPRPSTVSHWRAAAAICAMGAALLMEAPPTPARAAELPAGTVYMIASSPNVDRVYLATGGDSVLVADMNGQVIGQIPGLPFSTAVATGPDGTVWVALPNAPAIAKVDPRSLTVLTSFPVPSAYCPGSLAVTGPFVIFGFNCPFYANNGRGGIDGGVGVLDSRTGQVSIVTPFQPSGQVIVATSPGLPGRALAIDYASSATALTLYDVSNGTPVWAKNLPMNVAAVVDMAISPDGSTVALADKYLSVVNTYSTSDLSPGIAYQLGAGIQSVAWSKDGGTLAAMRYSISDPDSGAVFTTGNPTPRGRVELPADGPQRFPATRSLVASQDGSRLMVGTRAFWEYRAFLDALGTRPAALSLVGPQNAVVDQPLTLRAALSFGGVPAPAGATLRVNRLGPTGASSLGAATVDASGTATIADTPPYPGATTWSVHWPGDQTYTFADAQVTILVDKAPASLAIAFVPDQQRGKRLPGTIVVTLGPTLSNRYVTVTATTSAGTTQVFSQPVPVAGQLQVPYTVYQTTKLTATFNGAPLQDDATASTTVSLR